MAGRSEGLTLEPLWRAPEGAPSAGAGARGGPLPPALATRFPGELAVPLVPERPTVIANFVSSVDGVVALGPSEPAAGGGEISGFSDADRFMMALLRGLADVVVVGAGTVRVGNRHEWTARKVQPALAGVVVAWRAELRLSAQPTTIVVTASGNLDPAHPGLSAPDVPVIVATTPAGAGRLGSRPLPANITVEAVGSEDRVPAGAILELIQRTGARLALCEGGPHLFGELLRARLIDELFLTMAPQIIGRNSSARRLALVEGTNFGGGRGRWAKLLEVRHAGDDLFLRYRFE
ncbi:MAG: dihydrofolate reductase family protein [Candidatus Limnocylindrales bacterium]|jgi:riboflavin biosynthesis pyrimidine reductase